MPLNMSAHPDSRLLDSIGTTTYVAALLSVKPQAVSQWRRNGIPQARLQTLQVLRPDVFGQHRAVELANRAAHTEVASAH